MRIVLLISILKITINFSSFGQYHRFELIDESNISDWVPKLEIEYYGAYHYGDSESESILILFGTPREIIAQIKSGNWNSDGSEWNWSFKNLTNVMINNGEFSSSEYKGEFVLYFNNDVKEKCLKIYDSWSGITEDENEYEIGCRTGLINSMYSGKYPVASIQPLDPSELQKMSSKELQIMRNEIFARYGYKFASGGEMEEYFNKQEWYRPQHDNVTSFLTSLEKKNIELDRFVQLFYITGDNYFSRSALLFIALALCGNVKRHRSANN